MLRDMTKSASQCISGSSRLPLVRLGTVVATAAIAALGAIAGRVADPRGDFEAILARRTRRAFEHLGPTFVKAGQLLSSSAGPFPRSWTEELARCRDDVAPVRWHTIDEMLSAELGDARKRLVDIEPAPLAAGSIAQVHGARLDTGERVVVKVQRPGLLEILSKDVRLLRFAARLAGRLSRSCAAANPSALVDDFARGLEQQLSFVTEAANAGNMRDALSECGIRVPKVYTELSTERVLVMERLDGIHVDDATAMRSARIDPAAVVRSVITALLFPALNDGLFHADMHPGNMFVLPTGELALIDYGVVDTLSAEVRLATASLLAALSERRFADVVTSIFQLVDCEEVDFASLLPEVASMVGGCIDKPLAEIDSREVIKGMLEIAARHELSLPESLISFFKQMLYISGICKTLDPKFDVLEDLGPLLAFSRATGSAAA